MRTATTKHITLMAKYFCAPHIWKGWLFQSNRWAYCFVWLVGAHVCCWCWCWCCVLYSVCMLHTRWIRDRYSLPLCMRMRPYMWLQLCVRTLYRGSWQICSHNKQPIGSICDTMSYHIFRIFYFCYRGNRHRYTCIQIVRTEIFQFRKAQFDLITIFREYFAPAIDY